MGNIKYTCLMTNVDDFVVTEGNRHTNRICHLQNKINI